MKPEKIVYTAYADATGGREGTIKSNDGALDVVRLTLRQQRFSHGLEVGQWHEVIHCRDHKYFFGIFV